MKQRDHHDGEGRRDQDRLLPRRRAQTVENFVTLAKKGFYDGLTFHRVEPGFVAQGGDPKGNGTGGPGYQIKAEFNKQKHLRGTVAMARSQSPDSAGSQFYICFKPAPFLDGSTPCSAPSPRAWRSWTASRSATR